MKRKSKKATYYTPEAIEVFVNSTANQAIHKKTTRQLRRWIAAKMKRLGLCALLIAMVADASAQEIRRAIPVEESAWQWLKRTGNCTNNCSGDHAGEFAYMNWGSDTAPFHNNIEIAPDEPLVTTTPFREPTPCEPFYDQRAEDQIRNHVNDHGYAVSRLFRRGQFIGYGIFYSPILTKAI